ncbi:MAG: hypothetical protein AAGI91_08750 [Bacteroidota bacterium]
MTDERRYSQDELHAIFERAAKRQEEAQRAEAASRDQLTLAELQEIGAASGIDPAHVAAAARELVAAPPRDVPTFLGAPTEVERTRILPGPVSDEAWAQMVAEVRRTFDDDGSIGQIGEMREWTAVKRTSSNTGTAMRLTLEPTGEGTTRATLRKSVRETAKGFGIAAGVSAATAIMFFVLFVAGDNPDLWVPAAMMVSMALGFAGVTRGWLGYWNGKQTEEFDGVLDRLELVARSAAPATISAPSEANREKAPAARIDLDALPDASDAAGTTERTRTRS